jgi:methionine-rich copper-binding protein CopC
MTFRRPLAAAVALPFIFAASSAMAHARLVQSDPAAGATVGAPTQIALRFNEKLEGAFSGADLVQGTSKTPLKTTLAKDGVTLTGAPAKPLTAGAWRVEWHVVGADGHRMTGGYGFTVK